MNQRIVRRHLFAINVLLMLAMTAVPGMAAAQSVQSAAGSIAPTVLITGSSRGIGFELARQYAARGYRVIATARNPSGAANLVDLAAKSKNVSLEKLDVVDGASVAALAERLKGQPIDVLINNAGDTDEFKGQFFPKLAHDRFSYAMELNAHGPIRVAEALYANVQASQQKKIVAISSLAGSFGANGGGMPGGYWYKSSKAALNMLMLTLANDSKSKGIVVACLSPGQVDTHGYAARGITMPGTVDVAVSVGGLIKVIDGLSMAQTGTFIRYTGEVQPW
jgi:NAD(P)-dependent dehydrogenase (short-subunit alcohol dehydrogenase family)